MTVSASTSYYHSIAFILGDYSPRHRKINFLINFYGFFQIINFWEGLSEKVVMYHVLQQMSLLRGYDTNMKTWSILGGPIAIYFGKYLRLWFWDLFIVLSFRLLNLFCEHIHSNWFKSNKGNFINVSRPAKRKQMINSIFQPANNLSCSSIPKIVSGWLSRVVSSFFGSSMHANTYCLGCLNFIWIL